MPGPGRCAAGRDQIELSTREFDILHLLAANTGKVVSRYTILDEVWDGETDLRSNVIDVYLATIRSQDRQALRHLAPSPRSAGPATGSTREPAPSSCRRRVAGSRCASGWSAGFSWRCSCCSRPPGRSSTGASSTPSTAAWTPSWSRPRDDHRPLVGADGTVTSPEAANATGAAGKSSTRAARSWTPAARRRARRWSDQPSWQVGDGTRHDRRRQLPAGLGQAVPGPPDRAPGRPGGLPAGRGAPGPPRRGAARAAGPADRRRAGRPRGRVHRRRRPRPARAATRSSGTAAAPTRSPPAAPGLRLDVPAGRDDEVTRLGHTLNGCSSRSRSPSTASDSSSTTPVTSCARR